MGPADPAGAVQPIGGGAPASALLIGAPLCEGGGLNVQFFHQSDPKVWVGCASAARQVFTCKVDAEAPFACTPPQQVAQLTPGVHVFYVVPGDTIPVCDRARRSRRCLR